MTASLHLWMWPSNGQGSEGNPDGVHGLHETMFHPVARGELQATGSAIGHDNDEIEILGESRARSQSPYDAAVHTMQAAKCAASLPSGVALEGRQTVKVARAAAPAVVGILGTVRRRSR